MEISQLRSGWYGPGNEIHPEGTVESAAQIPGRVISFVPSGRNYGVIFTRHFVSG